MTLHLDDARWRSAVDAHLRDEATAEHATLLEQHVPRSEEHRAEAAFLAALAEPPADPEASPAWLQTAVDAYARTVAQTRSQPAVRSPRWPWLAAAAAIALVVGVGAALHFGSDEAHRARSFEIATLIGPASEERRTDDAVWTIESGSARLSALPVDQVVTVEAELCAARPGRTICADAGSSVTARGSGALALHRGSATIRSEDSDDARVELDEVGVHASHHSVVVIERQAAGWSVSVEQGSATVTELGSSRRLSEGESLRRGGRAPAPTKGSKARPSPKASALLGRARAQRREGDTRAAMGTYAELIRTHPRSPAAQAARMSLAQLHLDRGAAKDALRLFRAYEKRGGPLSEEAAYGEIRALLELGRSSEAKRATAAFVRRYPQSPYGAKLTQ
ncbi:MAG: tetratricopeptide repeat protein [Nannocystaceae bacterium]|nr:tetratricopeptide repeat protein [bacterium]